MKIRSNGQSPLVNPTRKITAFFTKKITPSPIADSSLQSKPNPKESASTANSYGSEVVGRRIKVFWPPEDSWYEGCVNHFDEAAGQHLVVYDDAEEEMLNLSKVKIEWLPTVRKFRRLLKRRASTVVEDDSADQDWGVSAEKEVVEDDDAKISKKRKILSGKSMSR